MGGAGEQTAICIIQRDALIELFQAQLPSKLCFLGGAVTPQKKHSGRSRRRAGSSTTLCKPKKEKVGWCSRRTLQQTSHTVIQQRHTLPLLTGHFLIQHTFESVTFSSVQQPYMEQEAHGLQEKFAYTYSTLILRRKKLLLNLT